MADEQLIHSAQDVIDAIDEINQLMQYEQAIPVAQMLNKIQEAANHQFLKEIAWPEWFATLASSVSEELDSNHLSIDHEAFSNMLIDKHRVYGSKCLTGWGPLGIVIRIDSKWNRYENMQQAPELEKLFENIRDTLLDILGYAVLGFIFTKELTK